jgi:hypothetical protein
MRVERALTVARPATPNQGRVALDGAEVARAQERIAAERRRELSERGRALRAGIDTSSPTLDAGVRAA